MKKVEFQRVRGACNRRTRRNWFVLHGGKGWGRERDLDGRTHRNHPASPSSFSFLLPPPLSSDRRKISGCRRKVSRDFAKLAPRASFVKGRSAARNERRKLAESGHPVNVVTPNLSRTSPRSKFSGQESAGLLRGS